MDGSGEKPWTTRVLGNGVGNPYGRGRGKGRSRWVLGRELLFPALVWSGWGEVLVKDLLITR